MERCVYNIPNVDYNWISRELMREFKKLRERLNDLAREDRILRGYGETAIALLLHAAAMRPAGLVEVRQQCQSNAWASGRLGDLAGSAVCALLWVLPLGQVG